MNLSSDETLFSAALAKLPAGLASLAKLAAGRLLRSLRYALPAAAVLFAGCVTNPSTTPRPLSPALRAELGPMALRVVATGPALEFAAPSTPAEISSAVKPAAPITPAEVVRQIRSEGGPGAAGIGALLAVPLLPVTTAVSAPVQLLLRGPLGALAGMPPEERNRAMASIAAAAAGLQFADGLQESVLARAGPRHAPGLAPAGRNPGPPTAKTMLALEVFGPALNSASGGGHAHRLEVDVSVRLLAAGDGHELYYDYLTYKSAARPYAEWARDNAAPLGEEAVRAIATLAEEIVQQVFVRTEVAPDEAERLAALGLSRRNVGPSLHSTAQPPAPTYRPPRVR